MRRLLIPWQASWYVMRCHDPHARCSYPVALSGMGPLFVFFSRCDGRLLGCARRFRRRKRRIRASEPFRRNSVPPHPECRSLIPFCSTSFPPSHRRLSPSGGTLIRAYPARPRLRAPARFAAARIARLIARARRRARGRRSAHLSCRLPRSFSRRRLERSEAAPREGRSIPPAQYRCGRSKIKLI